MKHYLTAVDNLIGTLIFSKKGMCFSVNNVIILFGCCSICDVIAIVDCDRTILFFYSGGTNR